MAPGNRTVPAQLHAAVAVVCDPSLADVVALAAWLEGDDLNVRSAAGHSRARVSDVLQAGRNDPTVAVVAGEDPLRTLDPLGRETDCYPWAWLRLAECLTSGPRAPDVVVVHTGAHFWPERGGHVGEHGSLNAPQSRAPLLVMGAEPVGEVPAVARTVDVAATLAAAAGAPYADGAGESLLPPAVDPIPYVVGLLWDGVPHDEVMTGLAEGWLPNLGRLYARGFAVAHGAVADFPSVTLVNHASALTGVGPHVHEIVHNSFFDRASGRSVVANHSSTWHRAIDLLSDRATTVFEQVAQARPGLPTACVNEPIDRGATYSTFALIRSQWDDSGAGSVLAELPDASGDPHASHDYVSDYSEYAKSTAVDAAGLEQVLGLWREADPPVLTWWNTTITDTGHHGGGPRSGIARAAIVDADRRLGAWLDVVEERDLLDRTVVVLTADHGSEQSDSSCRGDWDVALHEAGIRVRDEGYGFLYLD